MAKFHKVINRNGDVKEVSDFIFQNPRLMARHGYSPLPSVEKPKKAITKSEQKELLVEIMNEDTNDLDEAKIEGVSVFDQERKVSRWAKPLIKKHDIDISQVTGTGKDGMIIKSDIEHLI